MSKPIITTGDLRLFLKGLRRVVATNVELRKAECETKLANSSLRGIRADVPNLAKKVLPDNPADLLDRASMVHRGLQQFAVSATSHAIKQQKQKWSTAPGQGQTSSEARESALRSADFGDDDDVLFIREEDLEGSYMKSLGVEIMQQNEDGKEYVKQFEKIKSTPPPPPDLNVQAQRLNKSIQTEPKAAMAREPLVDESVLQSIVQSQPRTKEDKEIPKKSGSGQGTPTPKAKPLSKHKPNSQLGATAKARKVPASRISRLVSYGGLAAGLGIGALTEITKRSLGLAKQSSDNSSLLNSSPFLSEANAERIVDTLCRVRGAALKLGQILSIQDNTMINPELQKIFERVRNSADFMPAWQMERVMATEFGPGWRTKLSEFDGKPFAAASIGQVHLGKLHDGRPIAVKIQYPGVAQGIESDIDNLVSVFGIWNILPEGIFADKIIEVAKRELRWEVDYLRESGCAKKFRILLQDHPDYYVPEVVDELTTQQVYTTELIEGLTVDKFDTLDQDTRDRISFLLLDLFFRELFEFRFMQTDPNWSNFLYNTETKQVGLLDFGASREFRKEFVDNYLHILKGAADNDISYVLKYSRHIGFLTGYESKTMEKAHVDTVMILSESFRIGDKAYDFGKQDITRRIQEQVPIMVRERLCPPPEEIYSLHRKLSGIFLLCSKLRGRVKCRPILDRICADYTFRPESSKSS